MSLKYEKVDGVFPIGVSIEKDGRVKGAILFENIGLGPVWETEGGLLATVDEEDEIVLDPVVASPRDFPIECYSIVVKSTEKYSLLPWGLTLNPHTGVISGTLEHVTGDAEKTWYDGEEPQWVTEGGNLGTFDENETIENIIVSAVSPFEDDVHYYIINGALPWGLTMNAQTGEITGTVQELFRKKIEDPNLTNKPPMWSTPEGLMGIINEGSTFKRTIKASSRNGSSVIYRTIKGALPWGLTLDPLTGNISGVVSEVFGLPDYEPEETKPKINNIFEMNNVSLPYNSDEVFTTIQPLETVEIKISATAFYDRTITSYYVSNNQITENYNHLPFGLMLDRTTGVISGTVEPTALAGLYEIFITVMDDLGGKTVTKLKIMVEQGE